MGPDLSLTSVQYSQSPDISARQLRSPPGYPAPSLEHAHDQSHNKDDIKTPPAMYDLPENFSSKEVLY